MGRYLASKRYKTKRYSRDSDQVLNEDLASKASIHALKHQKFDEYLPGLGQHYCIVCAAYFESDKALATHLRTKVHKRQVKNLKFGPYTPEEAAAGAGRDVAKFLAKQQQQNAIQQQEDTVAEYTSTKGGAHRKKRGSTAPAEMDVETEGFVVVDGPETEEQGSTAVDEISV